MQPTQGLTPSLNSNFFLNKEEKTNKINTSFKSEFVHLSNFLDSFKCFGIPLLKRPCLADFLFNPFAFVPYFDSNQKQNFSFSEGYFSVYKDTEFLNFKLDGNNLYILDNRNCQSILIKSFDSTIDQNEFIELIKKQFLSKEKPKNASTTPRSLFSIQSHKETCIENIKVKVELIRQTHSLYKLLNHEEKELFNRIPSISEAVDFDTNIEKIKKIIVEVEVWAKAQVEAYYLKLKVKKDSAIGKQFIHKYEKDSQNNTLNHLNFCHLINKNMNKAYEDSGFYKRWDELMLNEADFHKTCWEGYYGNDESALKLHHLVTTFNVPDEPEAEVEEFKQKMLEEKKPKPILKNSKSSLEKHQNRINFNNEAREMLFIKDRYDRSLLISPIAIIIAPHIVSEKIDVLFTKLKRVLNLNEKIKILEGETESFGEGKTREDEEDFSKYLEYNKNLKRLLVLRRIRFHLKSYKQRKGFGQCTIPVDIAILKVKRILQMDLLPSEKQAIESEFASF